MRLPEWIRTTNSPDNHDTKHVLRRYNLSTVCEEARCPNRGECFAKPTATFMILGSRCTRNCGFCSVSSVSPAMVDEHEPENIAAASVEMKLTYIVITSVTRDDLSDGGAVHFAKTINAVRKENPHVRIEVLTPDFQGNMQSLKTVLDAGPDVFNHNIETIERLYPKVRPAADYRTSLYLLEQAKKISPVIHTKSGFMLGFGETFNEIITLLRDLRKVHCDFVTIGQYLRPTKKNLPVVEYVLPEVFEDVRKKAMDMGFKYVASGPLVRSSKHAEEMYEHV